MTDDEINLRAAYDAHKAATAALQLHIEAVRDGTELPGKRTFELIHALDRAHIHFMELTRALAPTLRVLPGSDTPH